MTPQNFPEANYKFTAPQDMDDSQVGTIPAYLGEVNGPNNLDGVKIVVVAWKPDAEELAEINAGGLIYLTCLGGLPGHTLQTSFHHATTF